MTPDFLQVTFLYNQVVDYLIAFVILVVGIFLIKILRRVIVGRLKRWAAKTTTQLDDSLIQMIERAVIPILYVGTFYVAIANLTLHPILDQVIDALTLIVATILGIRLLVSLVEYGFRLYWLTRRQSETVQQALDALIPAARIAIWALGIVFLLDNLGFDISAVVAGLGIGGVAIALASQGFLQDLFSYFSILFDRPFELGDFIIVGDFLGSVEHIGIKTTRLQSLSGEQLIFANTDLTSSRIRNFKRMPKRRVAFKFGVLYETSQEKLQLIPEIVQGIVENLDNTTFDRAHFSDYGDFSLNFEVVYYVLSSDYNLYMDIQQQLNLQLKQEFEARQIEFAYPTQVTYLGNLNTGEISDSLSALVADGKP
ncbi:mechanosensitive ion channel family protein [Coleofasciculus sp. F4-SAH-05]|uniref:mechanosensitive ion channel family protein n=1 Tax=Coleofasciculus sp. F4-SAH-05 TaxID=3069525 RepID=UPI0032FADC3E